MTDIRLAQEEDLPLLNGIYNWAVENTVATFDLEPRDDMKAHTWFQLHTDSYYPLYVIRKAGIIAGWGSLSPFHPRPAYRGSGEFSIYIDAAYQHQGLGDQLLDTLCREAESLGYHTLLGLITGSNTASLKLAAKHGFKEVGHYREVGWKFERWLDVVVVQHLFNRGRADEP